MAFFTNAALQHHHKGLMEAFMAKVKAIREYECLGNHKVLQLDWVAGNPSDLDFVNNAPTVTNLGENMREEDCLL